MIFSRVSFQSTTCRIPPARALRFSDSDQNHQASTALSVMSVKLQECFQRLNQDPVKTIRSVPIDSGNDREPTRATVSSFKIGRKTYELTFVMLRKTYGIWLNGALKSLDLIGPGPEHLRMDFTFLDPSRPYYIEYTDSKGRSYSCNWHFLSSPWQSDDFSIENINRQLLQRLKQIQGILPES